MVRRITGVAAAIVLLVMATTASAVDFAVGVRPINTLGFTGEATAGIVPDKLNLRGGINLFSFEQQGTMDLDGESLDYDAGIKLNSMLFTLDWHPWGKHFRLAPGLFYNKNEFSVDVMPGRTYEAGGQTFTPEDLGMVGAVIDYPDYAPYFGIGWGNAVKEGRTVKFAFDIGVIYMQSPTVEMVATEMLTPTAEQAAEVTEKMKDYNLWAVVSFGLTFKLF